MELFLFLFEPMPILFELWIGIPYEFALLKNHLGFDKSLNLVREELKGIKLFFSSVFWSLYLLIQPLGSNDLPQDEGVPLTRMNDNHSFHNFVSSDICKYLLTQGGWKNFNEN